MTIIQPNFNNITQNMMQYRTLNKQQQSAVSFGYDKELNQKVQRIATAADVPEILVLQDMCNTIENTIVDNENAPEIDEKKFHDVYIKLIPLKIALTRLVENYFPTLCYAETEKQHYLKEADTFTSQKIHVKAGWRYSLCRSLEDAYEDSLEDLDDESADAVSQSSEPANDTVKKAESSTKSEIDSIIKIFEPNEYTPKGFADVAGMDNIKDELIFWIIDPIKKPKEINKRKQYGIKMPNGFMLYGPPGCGKTFIAEALSAEAGVPLFKLKISEAGSKFIHESSKNYRLAFEKVEKKAKELNKPCILFIDEIDSVANSRDSLSSTSDHKKEEVNTLLDLLNGASARGIIVLAATNNPDGVDKAIRRSGRFDKLFKVDLPDDQARLSKIKLNLAVRKKAQNLLKNAEQMSEIVKATEGFSNSDIDTILESAAMKAMKRSDKISLSDVLESIEENQVKKLSPEDLKKYDIQVIKEKRMGFVLKN